MIVNRDSKTQSRARGHTNRPLASPGLTAYRCKNPSGWTMIGAYDHADAFSEALRSDTGAKQEDLEIWDGKQYVKVAKGIGNE